MNSDHLRVLLHQTPVGSLSRISGVIEFRLLESYRLAFPRPTLGQQFLDDLGAVRRSRARVPSWFSNLLPEGPLRALISQQLGVKQDSELSLLSHLGNDLPGAVRIEPDQSELEFGLGLLQEQSLGDASKRAGWHFSLAGVQLKFSARTEGKQLTIPVGGVGGDWIVKLPENRFPGVPANQYATMEWARASGIDVPETRLVDLTAITGLPHAAGAFREREAYAVRRFDRPGPGQRFHIEDFAQILDLYPEDKYRQYNYETIASLVLALAGRQDFRELLSRFVFMVASGNGDAHHKNWSVIYPDGVGARLSPAYDLVSTIQYMADDKLALNLGRSKHWADVSIATFRRMARKLQVDEAWAVNIVSEAAERIGAAWRRGSRDFGFSAEAIANIDRHMAAIPLLA